MKAPSPKTTTSGSRQSTRSFFSKNGEGSFFASQNEVEEPFFTPGSIQAKADPGLAIPPKKELLPDADEHVEMEEGERSPDLMRKPVFEGAESPPEDRDANPEQAKLLANVPQLGAGSLTYSSLPNGQNRMIQRIPFTQVIMRAPAPATEKEEGQGEQEEPIFADQILPTEEILTTSYSNSINSTLTDRPSVTRGGTPGATEFGVTGSSVSFSGVSISSSFGTLFGNGVYTVRAILEQDIQWQVRTATGPGAEVDIVGDTDPDIKACNYQLVSSDLTPNMSSDNGRPPRTNYWAEDLTIRHERFHAINQRKLDWGPQSTTAAQTWLNARNPSSARTVRDIWLPQALNEWVRVFNAFVALPSAEGDTYGDGAPHYLARANSIKAKGDAGDYGKIGVTVTNHPKGGVPYVVVAGDTLWAIAQRTYGSGRYWRQIHEANPGKARDGGNLIIPGTIFDLPAINIDQELAVAVSVGFNFVLSSNVVIAGGGSHEFLVDPKDVFDDTTNCTGDVDVDVFDADTRAIIATTWSLPGSHNTRTDNIEVTADIKTGP